MKDDRRVARAVLIALRGRRFDTYRNPLDAWAGYMEARRGGGTVPPWVLSYLDGAAEKLLGLAQSGEAVAPAQVWDALGMRRRKGKAPGGRGTAFSEFQAREEEPGLRVAMTVARALHRGYAPGEQPKLEAALAEAAELHSVSRSVVYRAWRKHGALAIDYADDDRRSALFASAAKDLDAAIKRAKKQKLP